MQTLFAHDVNSLGRQDAPDAPEGAEILKSIEVSKF